MKTKENTHTRIM